MSASAARRVAWALCALTIGLATARLALAIIDPASSDSSSGPRVPGGGVPVAAFEALVLVMLAVVGAVVASRQPHNPIGWIFGVISLSLGLLILSAHGYYALALDVPEPSRNAVLVAWLGSWIWIPAMIPTLTLFPLLFPTGRPLTSRWRPVVWMAIATMVVLFIGQAFAPGQFMEYPVDNPFGVASVGVVIEIAGSILMAVCSLTSLASLVLRFRRSNGVERQQIKWVAVAAVLFIAIAVGSGLIQTGISEDVGFATLLVGILIIAAAVAVAMLRYRLYDIDVVINRALVYGALTAMLAGAYLGSVLLFQLVLSTVTQGSGLAVAASTLATAALVRPARSRIQDLVDRRFFRRKYDAARTLERFSSQMRDQVDLADIGTELLGVVTETVQPVHASLWLRPQVRP
ncbi:MAG: histidine kinase N-terminal 7TM domain-containing protein [Solirubrobacteraceae bacterium]